MWYLRFYVIEMTPGNGWMFVWRRVVITRPLPPTLTQHANGGRGTWRPVENLTSNIQASMSMDMRYDFHTWNRSDRNWTLFLPEMWHFDTLKPVKLAFYFRLWSPGVQRFHRTGWQPYLPHATSSNIITDIARKCNHTGTSIYIKFEFK